MDVSEDEQPTEEPLSVPGPGSEDGPGPVAVDRPRRPPQGRRPSGARRPRPDARRPSSSGRRPAPRPRAQRRTVVILSVLTVVVVAVAVTAFALAPGGNGGSATPGTTVPGAVTTVPASELVTFRDDAAGFSIKYPRQWRKADIPDGPIRLVLLAGGLNGVSVRVDRTEVPTTSENLDNIKAVTDGIVGTNPTAKVLDQRQVTLNGMPGYYYLYTFTDEETGAVGAHGHYFLFKGRKMHSLVFQAVPQEDFTQLAAVFDQVAETFQSDPDLPPGTASTTAAPTTASPPPG